MASGDMTVVQYCDNKRGTRGTISFQAHSSSGRFKYSVGESVPSRNATKCLSCHVRFVP